MTTRYRTALAAAAFALTAGLCAPTIAQEATPWPELMMKMADANKDGMVTRQEYLDMAARMWDEKHAKMMKSDPAMKAGMMGKDQFMVFARNVFVDPGKVGGN
jgi:hypothetical protein